MLEHKYPSIYLKSNRSCCDYYPSNIFRNTWDLFKIGEYHSSEYFRFLAGPYSVTWRVETNRVWLPLPSNGIYNSHQQMMSHYLSSLLVLTLIERHGAYHLLKKAWNFWSTVKWSSNFTENPFENYRLPLEVVLFFRRERNGGNFLTICQIYQFSVSHHPKTISGYWITNGKRHLLILEKPLPLFNGHRHRPQWSLLHTIQY